MYTHLHKNISFYVVLVFKENQSQLFYGPMQVHQFNRYLRNLFSLQLSRISILHYSRSKDFNALTKITLSIILANFSGFPEMEMRKMELMIM